MKYDIRYQSLPLLVVILSACIGIFFDALIYFNEVWVDDGTYSHGYLSLLLIFYVIYCERRNLPKPRVTISSSYTILLLGTIFAAYVANFLGQHFVYRCLFLIALFFIIRAWFNKDESKFFIIPLLLLSLALPLWGLTLPPLQYISVLLVGLGINIAGLEVMINGFYISIPNGSFEVADGCSGLRYLLVGATLVVFYWYMYFKSTKSFYKLLAFNILLGLVTNWLRIGYLVYVGHISHMNDPLMTDHNMLGWYIFIVPVVLTFVYGRILEKKELGLNLKQEDNYA
jgi:exosortase